MLKEGKYRSKQEEKQKQDKKNTDFLKINFFRRNAKQKQNIVFLNISIDFSL